MWSLARRSRNRWAEVASATGIKVEQTGMIMAARRREAAAVLEEFLDTEMGEDCILADPRELQRHAPGVPFENLICALVSPHEIRVEAKSVLPVLLEWVSSAWDVDVHMSSFVVDVHAGCVVTARGELRGKTIFVCPGDEVASLMPELAREMGVQPCKLQMMRLADPGYKLPSPVMSDLGLVRYQGYSELASATALKERLEKEQSAELAAGVHLIAVQSGDGSMIVGDSHAYSDALDPFQRASIDQLILDEFANVLGTPPVVIERWVGTYAWSPERNWFTKEVEPDVHVTVITCGAGMSTAFAIAEDVVASAFQPLSGSASR